MPSTSAKQHRFMAAIAHSPSFAKKVGVSQSVGKDFTAADKGKTFKKGGMMKKRRFDEGGEIDYEVDENAEPERRSFGAGVSAKDREYNEPVSKPAAKAKPKAKPEAKPAAKESDASESAYTKAAKASFLGSPGKYLSEPLKRMRERMSSGDQQAFKPRDRGFKKGGMMKESKAMVGKEVAFFKKKGAPKSMIKHEKAEMMGMNKFAKGGGIESRGKTKGTMVRMATGGVVKFAKGGGIELRGKTRGKMC